ncbi:hypothetical protein ABT160_00605 [Streptomyces sp. NPDC001941]|uniref:hypothetical protein n=1 Tax=Streptomyces sp. NPDC001941 TaxID=3154659 RepID=UPI003333C1DE
MRGSMRVRAAAAALGLAGVLGAATAACQPIGDGLDTAGVAFTTDQTGTRELQRAGVQVSWLNCRASLTGSPRPTAGPRATGARQVAQVTCEGETEDGKPVRIDGRVTEERDGKCVRGDLTAKAGGREVFRAKVLGDCNAPDTTPPPGGGGRPGPTVTVTVTVTETAPAGK